jgi:hypothetical protein
LGHLLIAQHRFQGTESPHRGKPANKGFRGTPVNNFLEGTYSQHSGLFAWLRTRNCKRDRQIARGMACCKRFSGEFVVQRHECPLYGAPWPAARCIRDT